MKINTNFWSIYFSGAWNIHGVGFISLAFTVYGQKATKQKATRTMQINVKCDEDVKLF